MRRVLVPALLLALALLPGTSIRAAGPGIVPVEVASALSEYNANARFPLPPLSDSDLRRLVEGQVVKIRHRPDDPDAPQRVVGLLVTPEARDAVWIAIRDSHFSHADDLLEVQLSPAGEDPVVWYQHLDAPFPFADRHWVIDVSDTLELARATDGRAWEHWWDLTENGEAVAKAAVGKGRVEGMDAASIEDAIYTPVNHGAWGVMALPSGGTVLAYHVTSVVGGAIPEKMIADYILLTLRRVLRSVEKKAREQVPGHYTDDHVQSAPILGGDGRTVTGFDSRVAQ